MLPHHVSDRGGLTERSTLGMKSKMLTCILAYLKSRRRADVEAFN